MPLGKGNQRVSYKIAKILLIALTVNAEKVQSNVENVYDVYKQTVRVQNVYNTLHPNKQCLRSVTEKNNVYEVKHFTEKEQKENAKKRSHTGLEPSELPFYYVYEGNNVKHKPDNVKHQQTMHMHYDSDTQPRHCCVKHKHTMHVRYDNVTSPRHEYAKHKLTSTLTMQADSSSPLA